MTLPPELEAKIDKVITHYPVSKRSASMPLLHLIQEHFGFISDDAITWVAHKLGLQPINILELVTFYPMYRREKAGKYHIRVCRTLSCAMGGGYELMESMCKAAGIERPADGGHHNGVLKSADGKFSIEFVECLASCGTAPVCMVNDDFYEGVAPESASAVLEPYLLGKAR
jgi:NADH-quinone oxidoreductase subunit E